jgi:hypothetical protein
MVFEFLGLAMLGLCIIVVAFPSRRPPVGHTRRYCVSRGRCSGGLQGTEPAALDAIASPKFTARPLTGQRFRQNAVFKKRMDRSWI